MILTVRNGKIFKGCSVLFLTAGCGKKGLILALPLKSFFENQLQEMESLGYPCASC